MKIKLLSLLCALLLLVGALPAASALDGEALRSANTLAALNLVDSAGAAVDYNQNAPGLPGPTQCFCWCVLPERRRRQKPQEAAQYFGTCPPPMPPMSPMLSARGGSVV